MNQRLLLMTLALAIAPQAMASKGLADFAAFSCHLTAITEGLVETCVAADPEHAALLQEALKQWKAKHNPTLQKLGEQCDRQLLSLAKSPEEAEAMREALKSHGEAMVQDKRGLPQPDKIPYCATVLRDLTSERSNPERLLAP